MDPTCCTFMGWLAIVGLATAISALQFYWPAVTVFCVLLFCWMIPFLCFQPCHPKPIKKQKWDSDLRRGKEEEPVKYEKPQTCCILFCVLLGAMAVAFVFLFMLKINLDQGRLNSSACGASSCSHAIEQSAWPYNPTGWFPDPYGQNSVNSTAYVYCPCANQNADGSLALSCTWASANGLPIWGYPGSVTPNTSAPAIPNGGLATQNPNDYQNPGYGILNGWYLGFSVQPIGFCPGVDPHLNQQYIYGRGKAVCPLCLNFFSAFNFDVNAHNDCPVSMYNNNQVPTGSCYLCPPPTACGQVPVILGLLGGVFMVLLLGFACTLCY